MKTLFATLSLIFLLALSGFAQSPQLFSKDGVFLGNLNTNQFDPNSVANPVGRYGSKVSPDSINNPFGKYGSQFSPESATNPYATEAPKVVTPDGKYLGDLSLNPYAPNSTGNSLGRYGSPLSSDSINNSLGRYGSPISPDSATNPFGTGVTK